MGLFEAIEFHDSLFVEPGNRTEAVICEVSATAVPGLVGGFKESGDGCLMGGVFVAGGGCGMLVVLVDFAVGVGVGGNGLFGGSYGLLRILGLTTAAAGSGGRSLSGGLGGTSIVAILSFRSQRPSLFFTLLMNPGTRLPDLLLLSNPSSRNSRSNDRKAPRLPEEVSFCKGVFVVFAVQQTRRRLCAFQRRGKNTRARQRPITKPLLDKELKNPGEGVQAAKHGVVLDKRQGVISRSTAGPCTDSRVSEQT